MLMEKGADVEEKDNSGYTALDYAKSKNQKEVIDVLSKVNAKK
jgi:ankyrin repeat protein